MSTDAPAVLIVEDSEDMQYLLQRVLDRVAPADAIERFTACNADEAIHHLQRLQTDRPLLVLCDHRMPGMTGVELYDQARARFTAPGAAFHLFTSAGSPVQERQAAEAGIHAVHEKPFGLQNWESLLARIFKEWGQIPAKA